MAAADPSPRDPLESDLEAALCPGRFISYGEGISFLHTLQSLERRIGDLVPIDPTRAATLFETLLAGCYAKADEIDGSSGAFGDFVVDLFGAWVRARQASGADAAETVRRLLACTDDDPYGFAHQIERTVESALDPTGLAVLRRAVEVRLASASQPRPATGDDDALRSAEARRHRCGEILRAIHLRTGDLEGYLAACNATTLSADDCLRIARMLGARDENAAALGWLERGSTLPRVQFHGMTGGYEASKLKRELLVKLGRTAEAIEQAWLDFRTSPSTYTYDALLALVPASERSTVHAEAIDAAARASLAELVPLWIATREFERLRARLSAETDAALEAESSGTLAPAADAIEADHPELAARIHRALGMRILVSKKSRLYDLALRHFEAAKRCYARAGLDAAWRDVATSVRRDHYRKSIFPGFERLVAGEAPRATPTFLDEARARWRRRIGIERGP